MERNKDDSIKDKVERLGVKLNRLEEHIKEKMSELFSGKFFQNDEGRIYLYEEHEDGKPVFLDVTSIQGVKRVRDLDYRQFRLITTGQAKKINPKLEQKLSEWYYAVASTDPDPFEHYRLKLPKGIKIK